ncbi:MAG: protein-L-isoaspartate(D-aspartate) O-methyltransferase [Planctomycetes bacterium]|nr:protein-L-isoaspartate(D-aspartate) O-methyltransferase [Planctomycetota bacterium]
MGMASDELRWREERAEMVESQLRRRGIRDPRVLQAFLDVPRDRFVLPERLAEAYEDHPLDIGCGQTISQPYMVALMTEVLRLRGDERTLEVGTGSGYQTAILAKLCRAVYTVERLPALSRGAQEVLGRLGFANVRFRVGDGTLGWQEEAPFDRIIVTAGGPSVPPSLEAQLADAGRLVMPVGSWGGQDLVALERRGERLERESHGGCVFVRLVGKEGWPER